MTTVYISIGNSDDKLTQVEWCSFVVDVVEALEDAFFDNAGEIHGNWFSPTASPFQNACWCIEIPVRAHDALQAKLKALAGKYQQDSIAWAPALTQFLRPEPATT